jgi:hypothetical protein
LRCVATKQQIVVAITQEKIAAMVMLGVTCLVGVYFGLYYGFLILVPLTLAAAFACVAGTAVHGEPISGALLTVITPAIGLQAGYIIGLTGRDLISQFVARLNSVPSRRV